MIIYIFKDGAGKMQYRMKMRESYTADELIGIFAKIFDQVLKAYNKLKSHGIPG